jgi:AraC-like DNA-binding protein
MDARIAWTLAHMARQLSDPLSVAALAARVNLSPSRFASLFRREVGTSPARYLHASRMLCARTLLERTFLTVKEVMAQVGCNDASHFSRDFRRFHGIGPRECQSRARRVWIRDDARIVDISASAAADARLDPRRELQGATFEIPSLPADPPGIADEATPKS